MPHGSPEAQAIKENFIQALQTKYGMQRVELDFNQAVADSGRNYTDVNTANSRINRWVRLASDTADHHTDHAVSVVQCGEGSVGKVCCCK